MNRKITGFTLVEMAVVLVIIGLVLAGILSTFQAQMSSAKIRETRQSLADIRESLQAFALINGRLPCPADPTLANTTAGAGLEDLAVTGLCQRVNGVVPWATLGVKELDAWGGRFSYSVTDSTAAGGGANRFARRPPNPVPCTGQNIAVTFGLCSTGSIEVQASAGGASLFVAAVIVSHGSNRRGSFNPNGGARIAGALGDELENANSNTALGGALDILFINKPFVYDQNPYAATYFDDLVEIVPVTGLIGKMVSVGRLP